AGTGQFGEVVDQRRRVGGASLVIQFGDLTKDQTLLTDHATQSGAPSPVREVVE
ncbi:MAG: hypothetical protein QOK20_1457, partial [Acidimicrobiaceae bacterium]|nr:hypothetical protein [Acidimicrobiaceae bacterium]